MSVLSFGFMTSDYHVMMHTSPPACGLGKTCSICWVTTGQVTSRLQELQRVNLCQPTSTTVDTKRRNRSALIYFFNLQLLIQCVSCGWHIVKSCFCPQSGSLCLLARLLNPFTFNVTIDRVGYIQLYSWEYIGFLIVSGRMDQLMPMTRGLLVFCKSN